jgi:hypothetical protein
MLDRLPRQWLGMATAPSEWAVMIISLSCMALWRRPSLRERSPAAALETWPLAARAGQRARRRRLRHILGAAPLR